MTDKRVSKQVATREKNARFVVSSLRVLGPAIVDEVGRRLSASGPTAAMTLPELLEAAAAMLERDTAALARADDELIVELSDDQPARDTRDLAVPALRSELISAAGLLNSVYGFDLATTYNLGGETPANPDLLVKRAKGAVDLLRTKPIEASPLPGRPAVDPAALADAIEAKATKLSDALADVLKEAREYQLALDRRDRALEEWSFSYRGAASIASAFCTLAGRDELAAVVRPTTRQLAGEEAIEEPPATPATEPPATPPAAGPGEDHARPQLPAAPASKPAKSAKRKQKKTLSIPR